MREVGLTPSSVESFLTMEAGKAGAAAHYTTWEALVLGFANAGNLRGIRKQLVKRVPLAKPAGPKPERLKGARYDNRVHAWALPFLGSDASIVRRTQNALAADAEYVKRHGFAPVHHAAKFTVAGRSSVLLFGFFGAVLQALVPYAWGRRLLLQFPRFFTYGVFSHEGPTPEQIDGAGFSMTFFGKGFTSEEAVRRGRPDKQVVTKIRGPEPGELNAFGTGSAESVGLTGRPARPPPQATSRARSSWPTPRWSCWRSPGSSARPACGPPASSCSGPATSTACGRAASPSPPS